MARRFNEEGTGKIVLAVLIIILLGYVIMSFGGNSIFSAVSIKGNEKVFIGAEETYKFQLKATDPEQFKTDLHYRTQYGRWRIENENGLILSPGNEILLSKGIYDTSTLIKIPAGYQQIFLKTEIIEYQFSRTTVSGTYLKDNGTIRAKDILPIEIMQCQIHADCNLDTTCLGKFGYCNANGLCEMKGDCGTCNTDSDCLKYEKVVPGKEYKCQNSKCQIAMKYNLFDQLQQLFSEPLTEPGKVEQGQLPEQKEIPTIISAGVIIMFIVFAYLLIKRKS